MTTDKHGNKHASDGKFAGTVRKPSGQIPNLAPDQPRIISDAQKHRVTLGGREVDVWRGDLNVNPNEYHEFVHGKFQNLYVGNPMGANIKLSKTDDPEQFEAAVVNEDGRRISETISMTREDAFKMVSTLR